jgi:protein-disulfide isomerase
MRDKLSAASTAMLTLCAVVLTALTVRREFFAQPPAQEGQRTVAEWKSYAEAGQRTGPADAAVTIVEFADFQCPACRVTAENLRKIRTRYPEHVAVLYRHAPIPSHEFAADAARASQCAAEQGRFQAYHDALFAHQKSIGEIRWTAFADSAGVASGAAFEACMARTGTVAAVENDRSAARRLGVNATPTLLVNDQLIIGAPSEEELAEMVEKTIRGRRAAR